MFSNVGKKIKVLTIVMFIIESVGAFITGLCISVMDSDMFLIGLPIAFGGPIVLWIMSWFVYGFGEIIDKLSKIEKNTRGDTQKNPAPVQMPANATRVDTTSERINKVERLYEQGLISKEEYEKLLERIK